MTQSKGIVPTGSIDLSGLLEFSNNPFERLAQMKDLRNNLSMLIRELSTVIDSAYEQLVDVDDDKYIIEPVFDSRKTSTLDAELFAEEMPENYKNALQMSTSDIVKLIGKDKLRQIVIDTVGWDVFEENATVSITEARKNIPKAKQNRYIKEEYKQVDYVVREKE